MHGGEVLSTGDVARICRVAPRTVSKWIDSGKLPGFRIPGSQDRRVKRQELARFLKEHNYGFQISEADQDSGRSILLASSDEQLAATIQAQLGSHCAILVARDSFEAGAAHAASPKAIAVLDAVLGKAAVLQLLAKLRKLPSRVIVLAGEDEGSFSDYLDLGVKTIYQRPVNPDSLVEQLTRLIER